MVDIPAQLQRQMDEVEAYDKAIEDANAAAATPPANDPPLAPAAPVEVPAAPPAPAPVAKDGEDWKQKYLTLQGMFNAEVPRLNAQLRELQAQLTTALQAKPAEAPKPAPAPPKSSISDKDVEAFGSDLLDVVKRQAADVMSEAQARWDAERQQLERQVADLTKASGSVAERQASSDRSKYFADLGEQVPDYQAVNVDPGFLAWLAETDPLTGLIRQTYVNDAFEKLDATRTATLFKTWKATQAPPPAPQPAPAKTAAQQQLERQTAPGGSKAPTPVPTDPDTKVWTMNEIDQFYRDDGRGMYKGKAEERARIEASIDLALQNNRVVS